MEKQLHETEYATLKVIEQHLKDGLEGDGHEVLEAIVEIVLTIIKDRKATIEEERFNDPNYYKPEKEV